MSGHRFNGSAMVIVLNSDLKQVATGYCPQDGIRKFFGGKIELEDTQFNTSEEIVAMNCVFRELQAEAGISQSDISFITKLNIRRWVRYDKVTKKQVPVFQYFFVAFAKDSLKLPTKVDEEDEMTDRKFLDIHQVLTSWSLPYGDRERTNPIHAIALMRCLHFLEENISGDKRFESFFQMLDRLEEKGVHRDTYIAEIEDALSQEHLQLNRH